MKFKKIWENLGNSGKTDISETISVNFSLFKERIQVKAALTKPALTKESKLDFGSVQFGELTSKNITVHNPSEAPLNIQFLLAPSEFVDHTNMSVFKKTIPENLRQVKEFILLSCLFNMKKGNEEKHIYPEQFSSELLSN